jgi:hypothetical protein
MYFASWAPNALIVFDYEGKIEGYIAVYRFDSAANPLIGDIAAFASTRATARGGRLVVPPRWASLGGERALLLSVESPWRDESGDDGGGGGSDEPRVLRAEEAWTYRFGVPFVVSTINQGWLHEALLPSYLTVLATWHWYR